MIRICFVCLGNICRSPMAVVLMKALLRERGLETQFEIAGAATSNDEVGNPVYPPVRALLNARGLCCDGMTAHQLHRSDYTRFDYFIGMDGENRRNLLHLFNGDPEGKVSLLMDYTDMPHDVSDPWYTRDFQAAARDIELGCHALLDFLLRKK